MKIDRKYIKNVQSATLHPGNAYGCTSRVFAYICYKLASYAADYYWRELRNAEKSGVDQHIVNLLEEMHDLLDGSAYVWGRVVERLNSVDTTVKGWRKKLEKKREQDELFSRLIESHWDENAGVWKFGNIQFSEFWCNVE